MPVPLVPLIVGGASAIAGALGSHFARKKQRRHELKMAKYQYSKDLEMWNRSNEYNSPEQQMKRLKDAGLNPNLVYGSSAPSGMSSSTLPKYQQARPQYGFDGIQSMSLMGQYQDLKVKEAQEDLLKQRLFTEQSNTALKDAGLVSKRMQNAYAGELARYNYEMAYNTQLKMASEADKAFAEQYILRKSGEARIQTFKLQRDLARLNNAYKNKEISWYEFNRLAGPISQTLRLVPGVGKIARPKGVSGRFRATKLSNGKKLFIER